MHVGRAECSSGRDVEASLLQFVFHVTLFSLPQVPQHFGEYQFQGVRAYVLIGPSFVFFYLLEAFPADVESRPVAVCGIGGCVAIDIPQPLHIILSAQYGCDDDFVGVQPFGRQGVEEVLSDALEQCVGLRHEVGDGVCQGVQVIGVARGDFFQSPDAPFSLLP